MKIDFSNDNLTLNLSFEGQQDLEEFLRSIAAAGMVLQSMETLGLKGVRKDY